MELDQALKRVQQLINKAEAPIHETDPVRRAALETEQNAAREMADALMLKYAIEEAQLDKSRPEAARMKPGKILVSLTGYDDLLGYVAQLAQDVGKYCRCQVRSYKDYDYTENCWMAAVYGFESDLHYFEIMYTTLRLHMIGALNPKPDPSESIEENAYRLHNAGLNWFDIAKLHGWVEITPKGARTPRYRNSKTGEETGWKECIGIHKAAYQRAIKTRGEQALRVPPSGVATFRRSAAMGYSTRLRGRLRETEAGRDPGTTIILRSRVDDISALFKEDNPELFTEQHASVNGRKIKYVQAPYSEAGYRAGVRHANTASLNPAAPGNQAKAVE